MPDRSSTNFRTSVIELCDSPRVQHENIQPVHGVAPSCSARGQSCSNCTPCTHTFSRTQTTAFFFRKNPTSCCVLRIKRNSCDVRQRVTDYFTYPFGTVSGKRISGIMKTSSFSLRVMRRVSYLLDVVLL